MTTRRRANEIGGVVRRGMAAVPFRPTPEIEQLPGQTAIPGTPEPAAAVERQSEPPAVSGSKYTARLDPETAANFDALALIARRKPGRRVVGRR